MKVNNENIDEEVNDTLEASYTVEPGYVKQMIDRFSSVFSSDHTRSVGEDPSTFKLPLLHSKSHKPFQYPVLLANRSAVPVKTHVNIRGSQLGGSGRGCNISNNVNGGGNNCSINSTSWNGEEEANPSRQHFPSKPQKIHANSLSTKSISSSQHNTLAPKNAITSIHTTDVKSKAHLQSQCHQQTLPRNTTNELRTSSPLNKASTLLDSTFHSTIPKTTNINKDSINSIENGGHQVLSGNMADDSKTVKSLCTPKDSTNAHTKDGHYFLALMAHKGEEMMQVCEQFQNDLTNCPIDEAVMGKIRSAIGKANLLLTKKFKQFNDLCAANLTSSEIEQFQVTNEDLEGFWDMVLIQIGNVETAFEELAVIKTNNWKELSPQPPPFHSPTSKHPPHPHKFDTPSSKAAPKTPGSGKSGGKKERSSRLQAAMQAGRRQRKTSQSDQVLIFVADKTH